MKNTKKHRYTLCPQAALMLKSGLGVISAALIYILFTFEYAEGRELVQNLAILPQMIENVALSGVIVVSGSLLFDYVIKKDQKKNRKE